MTDCSPLLREAYSPLLQAKANHLSMIQAQSPGKLIISGEHAAVYGKPALAMAVNCYADTYVECTKDDGIAFDIPGLDFHLNYDAESLAALHDKSLDAYERFLEDELSIQEVLPNAVELIPFAFSLVWMQAGRPAMDKLRLRLDIGIPIGCGMGSSAAVGLSVLQTAAKLMNVTLDERQLFSYSLCCERLMHGHPSGVDTHVTLHGGVVRFQAGTVEARHVPAWEFALLNTGRPVSSTGECVETVRRAFVNDPIWSEFEAVTDMIDGHLEQAMDDDLLGFIRQNHRLLCRIGVVPQRVQAMINDIEAKGGAAKICGAGAVRGENGGIVLVAGDLCLADISERYQVEQILCRPVEDGSRCPD